MQAKIVDQTRITCSAICLNAHCHIYFLHLPLHFGFLRTIILAKACQSTLIMRRTKGQVFWSKPPVQFSTQFSDQADLTEGLEELIERKRN